MGTSHTTHIPGIQRLSISTFSFGAHPIRFHYCHLRRLLHRYQSYRILLGVGLGVGVGVGVGVGAGVGVGVGEEVGVVWMVTVAAVGT